jgi:perosamine synthetase
MIKPAELNLRDMGNLADSIPGPDPEVERNVLPGNLGRETSREYIPVCEPTLDGNEMLYVTNCLEKNWISSAGDYIQQFQDLFAEKCGARYGIACSNGTVALHLALAALGIEPGDEVIVPSFTMIATANAVTYCGAKPILVDSELGSWNMDLNQVKDRITPRTKAIIPVHTYGHPVDMDGLNEVAEKNGIIVLEDAAEAHGAKYKGQTVGSLGTAACFSFYANKILTTGEGGIVTTNDARLASLLSTLRDHAFSEERHFWHKFVGFNYRMTNMQAAMGLAQTEKLEEYVNRRRANAAYYTELLKQIPGITTPPEAEDVENVFWMYGIIVDEDQFGMHRDGLRAILAGKGIETRTFFIPMHCQPIYWDLFKGERYPNSEFLCRKGFYLPSASCLLREEIDYIAATIRDAKD